MAVTAYTSDDLLTRVKARVQLADTDLGSEGRFTSSDILAVADDAIRSTVARVIWNADDGRAVRTYTDLAITAGTRDYRLPDRAVGAGPYDVLIVDAGGNERSSRYIDPADAWRWQDGYEGAAEYAHTLLGESIRLLPTPTATSGYLRVQYRRRPSRLVLASACAAISSSTTSALTVTAVPSAWGSSETIDVVLATPGGDSVDDDVDVSISGTTLTRASGSFSIPADAYACLAGTTCVLPVPEEAVPFLTALVAFEVDVSLGDGAASQALAEIVRGRREELQALIADRNREDQAVIPRYSHLRAGRRMSGRGWR